MACSSVGGYKGQTRVRSVNANAGSDGGQRCKSGSESKRTGVLY